VRSIAPQGKHVIAQVSTGATRHSQDRDLPSQKVKSLPTPQRVVLEGDAFPVAGGGIDPGLGPATLELRSAADVITVVMGLKHGRKIEAAVLPSQACAGPASPGSTHQHLLARSRPGGVQ